MLIMIITMSMLLSLTFMFLSHPLSLGMVLLMQTVSTSLILGFYSMNFWFSYILFMIMVGGMLVLFIYMTSVASNEKFTFSKNLFIMILMFAIILSSLFLVDFYFYNLNSFSSNQVMFSNQNSFELSFSKYFNYPGNMILAMLIIYLFITLIAVVKITNVNYGPLRQKF